MGIGSIGTGEMIIVMVIVLLIFGPKNLPKLANAMGRAINDFKKGLSGVDAELRAEIERDEAKAAEAKAAQIPAQPAATEAQAAQKATTHESL